VLSACHAGVLQAIVLAAAGCGTGLAGIATPLAERELHCGAPALRMRGVGVLRTLGAHPRTVELYEASGCDQEQLYVCAVEMRGCVHEIAALPWPDARPVLEREQTLLRTAARARCPEDELRVVQESETLFRFEACDGAWLFHCRAHACVRLPVRAADAPTAGRSAREP
jgi:hypothetical protein